MWSSALVKHNGMINFKANYWSCVAAAFILGLASGTGSIASQSNDEVSLAGSLAAMIGAVLILAVTLMLLNPLKVGCRRFFLVNSIQTAKLDELKHSFRTDYMNVVVTMLMTSLFIALWSLLLIIPGIIKAYEYRLVEYILCEDPSISYREAQAKSKAMMQGNKMDAFMYDLSFIGWYILGILTCGIALIFYVEPYKAASDAQLYVEIRNSSNIMSSGTTDYQTEASYSAPVQGEAKDVEFEVESDEW